MMRFGRMAVVALSLRSEDYPDSGFWRMALKTMEV